MKLQKPQFSLLAAVDADVSCTVVACSVAVSEVMLLSAPMSVPVRVRTAQQGCAEMGSAGFGAGSLQGSATRGKIPHLLPCSSLPPLPFSPFSQRGFVESADHRVFASSSPCSSIPSGVCFPVLPRLLHLNTVGVALHWVF